MMDNEVRLRASFEPVAVPLIIESMGEPVSWSSSERSEISGLTPSTWTAPGS